MLVFSAVLFPNVESIKYIRKSKQCFTFSIDDRITIISINIISITIISITGLPQASACILYFDFSSI